MNLKDIEYMIKIAEKKKFSTAAKELYITQPALSQTIQKLENELNVKLFARKRNGVILTDAGRLFLQDAQTILYHLECLKRNMQNAGSLEVRTLRIGIAPLLSQFYFASPLIMYQKKYPNIELSIVEDLFDPLFEELLADRVDLLFVALPDEKGSFEFEPILTEEIFLAVPKEHPMNQWTIPTADGYAHANLQDFKNDSFIMVNVGQSLRTMGIDACRRAGFEPKIVFETGYINTANSLVSAGIGVSFIPYMIFSTRKNNGGNIYYHIDGAEMHWNIAVVYKDRNTLPFAAKEFIQILKECYATL